ncbi:hypothetical protein EZS27_003940 [termite gut metagenome]|uniref:Uncharacterized protein n=1 Tax=termite gut metagenome TaxID=433724 RepID=A0A5J4ST73_9ZZZZ
MQAFCLQSGRFVMYFLLFYLEGEGVNFKLCPKSGFTLNEYRHSLIIHNHLAGTGFLYFFLFLCD